MRSKENTLRKQTCPRVTINNITVPNKDTVRYLGMTLDRRLTWKQHITDKSKQLRDKLNKFYWLIGRRSNLSTQNKIIDPHYGRENFFLVAHNHHIVHETILFLVDSSYLWYNFSLDISIDDHRRWEHFYRLPIIVILDEIFVFK